MAAVPRAGFLPPEKQDRASYDGPIPIGHGQTNSQPRTVADMLRLLDVRPAQRILDVGSGSGWTTALLAHLVGSSGQVIGVELEPRLVAFGRANLGATQQPWARVEQADPKVLGWPKDGPYDRILVSANADKLPDELNDQMGTDGRMVVPVRSRMILVERSDGGTQTSVHGYYSFVPLR